MNWRLFVGAALLLSACSSTVPHNTGVYLLVDTSGSYNRQVSKAEQIILFALSRLQPLDSFAVARIDTASFSEKNIIAKATFDDRPSTANQQKRAFASRVQKFVDESKAAQYTDITGRNATSERLQDAIGLKESLPQLGGRHVAFPALGHRISREPPPDCAPGNCPRHSACLTGIGTGNGDPPRSCCVRPAGLRQRPPSSGPR